MTTRLPTIEQGRTLTVAAFALFVVAVSGPGDADTSGINGLGRIAWALADFATVCVFIADNGRLRAMLFGNPWLAAWPALAVASAVWSLTPTVSLYHGLQLLMTLMVGYLALSTLGLRRFLLALVLGLGLTEALSILALLRHADGAIGIDGTWIGAFTHKNVLGSMMVLEIVSCIILMADGRHWRIGLAAVLPAVVLLVGSRSGTSAVSLMVALAVMGLAAAWRRGSIVFGIGIGLLVVLAGVLVAAASSGTNFASLVLGGLGKDDTLTGRTVLWQFGLDQIRSAPLLGIGYKAYWESATTSAAYLRYVIGQDLWFFHNNAIDVTVAFGVVGLAIFVTTLLVALRRGIAGFAADPQPLQLWPLLLITYVIVEAAAEDPLFQNHSLQQMLFAVAMTSPALARTAAVTVRYRARAYSGAAA